MPRLEADDFTTNEAWELGYVDHARWATFGRDLLAGPDTLHASFLCALFGWARDHHAKR